MRTLVRSAVMLLTLAFCVVAGDIAERPQIHQTANATTLVNPFRYATTSDAVSIVGSETVHTSTSVIDSFSVTVPSNATAIIVVAAGVASSATNVSELNFDDGDTYDFTLIGQPADYSGNSLVEAHIITSADSDWPGSGSKTLYYELASSPSEGMLFSVFYVDNINTSTPIGNTAVDHWDYPQQISFSLTGVGSNDMGVIAAWFYNMTADVTATGQTVLVETSVYNSDSLGIAYNEGGGSVQTGGSYQSAGVGFVLEAATQ